MIGPEDEADEELELDRFHDLSDDLDWREEEAAEEMAEREAEGVLAETVFEAFQRARRAHGESEQLPESV